MLQITADVFSGRPNPVWVVTDEQEARATIRELLKDRGLMAESAPAEAGLGFRGLIVDALNDELAGDLGASRLYLPISQAAPAGRALELAERLIGLLGRSAQPLAEGVLPLDQSLEAFLKQLLDRAGIRARTSVPDSPGPAPPVEEREAAAAAVSCTIELAPYNPGAWNNDAFIREHNNCYHYASNKRRDTFRILPGGGQPGAGCGHMYTAITCAEVTRAALCDGLHRRYDCFPPSENPRYLVALVIAPGPGFVDFHWYRKNKEGFLSHKPGSTAVRNVDNRGQTISDPATCDRDGYTIFCGYFYTCKSQKIK